MNQEPGSPHRQKHRREGNLCARDNFGTDLSVIPNRQALRHDSQSNLPGVFLAIKRREGLRRFRRRPASRGAADRDRHSGLPGDRVSSAAVRPRCTLTPREQKRTQLVRQ
jgi:hypothetical protein